MAKSPEGRRFLWKIMSDSGIFLNGMSLEVGNMAFEKGRRSIGLSVLHTIFDAKPSLFGQMQEEHASEHKREEIEISNDKRDPLSL